MLLIPISKNSAFLSKKHCEATPDFTVETTQIPFTDKKSAPKGTLFVMNNYLR